MSTKNIIGIFVICFIVISITMAIIFRPQEKEDQPFITPYQVTIKSPYTTQRVTSESGYLVNETAEIFVVVPITVKNISDEEFIMFGDDFELVSKYFL